MKEYFEGWYLKHQKGDTTLALIPGRSSGEDFIQVVTNEEVFHVPFPAGSYKMQGSNVRIGSNTFTRRGIKLDMQTEKLTMKGMLLYKNITPIAYDIMGPFSIFPMECRHSVISMNHELKGHLHINGKVYNFTGGKGYIEGDRGSSFPSGYTWVQSNCFPHNTSVMAAAANIPFAGFQFWGCICIVHFLGKEYRLATYKGAKIVRRRPDKLDVIQGKYRLIIDVPQKQGHALKAPDRGEMRRVIHEVPAGKARFRFYINGQLVLDEWSSQASFEHV